MMDLNNIKKSLYRENPQAEFDCIIKGKAYYKAVLENDSKIMFEIPVNDMGDASFNARMDSKLLIRYIIVEVEESG